MASSREQRTPRLRSLREEELIEMIVDTLLDVWLGNVHPVYGERRVAKLTKRLRGRWQSEA